MTTFGTGLFGDGTFGEPAVPPVPPGGGYPLGGEGTFVNDVACDVVDLSWRRGAPRGGGYDAGTLTITLDNTTGNYSPATDDVAVPPDGLQTGVPIVVILDNRKMFAGVVTVWSETFEPGPPAVNGHATDRWAELSVDLPELVPPAAAVTGVQSRVEQILDRANWGSDRVLSSERSKALQESGLAQNLATEMANAVGHWTETGDRYFAYVGASGYFYLMSANGHGSIDWDTGDITTPFYGPYTLTHFDDCVRWDSPYSDGSARWVGVPFTTTLEGETVRNDVTVARTSGTARRYEHVTSQQRYGRQTWQRLDYGWTAADEDAAFATFQTTVLERWAVARPVVESLDIDLAFNDREMRRISGSAPPATILFARTDLGNYIDLEHTAGNGRVYRWGSRICGVEYNLGGGEATLTLTLDETLV
jgi:hypothetical protein